MHHSKVSKSILKYVFKNLMVIFVSGISDKFILSCLGL